MSSWSGAGRGALGGFGSGAGLGALFGGGVPGALIGGGIGLLSGALVGGLSSGNDGEIYDQLMAEYLQSPEKAAADRALADMQTQATTQGPTAQEKTALDQALNAANDQFGASYGAILSNLRARTSGGGGAAQAAMAASEGQGRANNMFGMAESAAAQEDARRQQARSAYTQMAQQAQRVGDQYRQWASGQAYNRDAVNEATAVGTYDQALSGVGKIADAYKQSQQPNQTNAQRVAPGVGLQTTHLGVGGGAGGRLSVPSPFTSVAPSSAGLDTGASQLASYVSPGLRDPMTSDQMQQTLQAWKSR